MQPSDRKQLDSAVHRHASTRLDWEELTDGTSLEAAGERRKAIVAYAAATDPKARTARERGARDALAAAREQEADARRELEEGLEAYGLTGDGAADLDPSQIRAVLAQRSAAGRFARKAIALREHQTLAASTGTTLDHLLCQLGFDDGDDLAGRLGRAIASVEAARRRRLAAADTRARDELEAEIAELGATVARHRRLSWDLTPDPTEAPADPARRRSICRATLAAERVRILEEERTALTEGPTAVRRRVADRIARTTFLGETEEALPLIIDDALVDVGAGELFKLLDLIVRLSSRTQIVLLTSDATIAKWARREAAHGIVTLLETDGAAVR